MEEIEKIKLKIDEKKQILKQLEGVYRTSHNTTQRTRVSKEIEGLRESIKNLQGKLIIYALEYDFVEDVGTGEDEKSGPFEVLNQISVPKFRSDSKDREIDAVISYLDFFEDNYLSVLSEFYIKLDFNHSQKRDMFYPRYMEIKKILKEYNYELDIMNREEFNNIAFYRDRSVIHKIRYRYLLALDKYFRDLKSFLEVLIDDFKTSGNIVLNPYDILSFNEFEANKRLNNMSVFDSLVDMHGFVNELLRFLGMPNL
jgi:hypothetical protein